MWSQLLQFSQLSQSTTIVATPTTIVAKNHNCRNSNHNCRNLDQPKLSQHQSQMSQFFQKKYCVFNNDFVQNYDISSNFQQSLLHFSQLNYDNYEILWHTIRLSYNCHNFDIELVTIVTYLKSLLCHMKKIVTFATTRFLNTIDDGFVVSGIKWQ